MLFAVVVVFFVCNVPPLVVNILEVLKINVNALNNTSNLLVTFNSSVNLVIYCIFGDKFKRILFSFFFCPPMVKRRSGTSEYMTRYPLQPYRGEFKWVFLHTYYLLIKTFVGHYKWVRIKSAFDKITMYDGIFDL